MKVLLVLAVLVAAVCARPVAEDELLQRLLRLLREDKEDVQKRDFYAFGYDPDKQTIRYTMRICKTNGKICSGRQYHIIMVHRIDDKYLMLSTTESYADGNEAPNAEVRVKGLEKGEQYRATTCVMYKDGSIDDCNSYPFEGGNAETFKPVWQDKKDTSVPEWIMDRMGTDVAGNNVNPSRPKKTK